MCVCVIVSRQRDHSKGLFLSKVHCNVLRSTAIEESENFQRELHKERWQLTMTYHKRCACLKPSALPVAVLTPLHSEANVRIASHRKLSMVAAILPRPQMDIVRKSPPHLTTTNRQWILMQTTAVSRIATMMRTMTCPKTAISESSKMGNTALVFRRS